MQCCAWDSPGPGPKEKAQRGKGHSVHSPLAMSQAGVTVLLTFQWEHTGSGRVRGKAPEEGVSWPRRAGWCGMVPWRRAETLACAGLGARYPACVWQRGLQSPPGS